jgi:hypothetical protein
MVTPGTLSGSPAESHAVLAIDRLRPYLGHAAHDHVFDGGRIDVGSSDELTQHVGGQVCRVNRREAAIPLPHGAANGPHNVCLGHHVTSMTQRPAAHLRVTDAPGRRSGAEARGWCARDVCRQLEATAPFGQRHSPSRSPVRPPIAARDE